MRARLAVGGRFKSHGVSRCGLGPARPGPDSDTVLILSSLQPLPCRETSSTPTLATLRVAILFSSEGRSNQRAGWLLLPWLAVPRAAHGAWAAPPPGSHGSTLRGRNSCAARRAPPPKPCPIPTAPARPGPARPGPSRPAGARHLAESERQGEEGRGREEWMGRGRQVEGGAGRRRGGATAMQRRR